MRKNGKSQLDDGHENDGQDGSSLEPRLRNEPRQRLSHVCRQGGKKGRTKTEVDEVVRWLTGYTHKALEGHIKKQTSVEDFFTGAPKLNPQRRSITGVVCGVRVEDIEEPLIQEIRYLDKLIDELAKGRPKDKVLRKQTA